MQRRPLGQTGLEVSILGFPGIALKGQEQADCDRLVSEAFEAGISYFDIAPGYGDAQDRLGPALASYRDRCVLNCKTMERSAAGATADLERSLRLLQTDHFDVYQFHAVTTDEEVDQILASGGALEAYEAARKAGKIRHIGLSAHNEAAAIRLIETGVIETALFPINFPAWTRGDFGPTLHAVCLEKGIGILAIKSMARRRYGENEDNPDADRVWYVPEDRQAIVHLQLRFTLNQPGVAAAIPAGLPKWLRLAISLADEFGPLSEDELTGLREAVAADVEPVFRS
ncbi:aldo/keto reductase [Mucisphaera sp.]|uniref:aldo/keto reductase n=1 Tax=Mucisphaera sp. TaxID=2913024 RepID=UPI003D11DEEB